MISPDCAGLDKVRLHYDFPAVNCIICKEKKKYFHLFSKSCGWRMLPRDIVPAQICHWFFLILLSSFKSCDVALASSTESLLFLFFNMRCSQRKVTASYSNSFLKKKSINVESVMPPECYPEAKPSRRKFLLNRMHCAVTWLFNTTIETMQRQIAGGHLNCFEYTCNQKWRGAAMLNICWSTKSMHFLDLIKKKDCEFRNTYVKESINPFPKQIFTLSLILVI